MLQYFVLCGNHDGLQPRLSSGASHAEGPGDGLRWTTLSSPDYCTRHLPSSFGLSHQNNLPLYSRDEIRCVSCMSEGKTPSYVFLFLTRLENVIADIGLKEKKIM